jgi:hypothetical protein
MCDECVEIDKKIRYYKKFIDPSLDPVTMERIETAIKELEKHKKALH